MSDLTERLDDAIDKNVALCISMMSPEIRERYHSAFCSEAADEIDRLTRELAEAREALGKAEAYIPTETVECRGDKCRNLWCVSCFGEEEAEQEIERAKFLAEEIRALKEKP